MSEFNEIENNVENIKKKIDVETRKISNKLNKINHYINIIDSSFEDLIEIARDDNELSQRVRNAILGRLALCYKEQFIVWKEFLNNDLDRIDNILSKYRQEDYTKIIE